MLQHHQAASFGVSQTRVSRLATVLLTVLSHVLARRGLLPVRNGAELAQHLVARPDEVFAYDGVGRGIPSNADRNGQAVTSSHRAYLAYPPAKLPNQSE